MYKHNIIKIISKVGPGSHQAKAPAPTDQVLGPRKHNSKKHNQSDTTDTILNLNKILMYFNVTCLPLFAPISLTNKLMN